MTFSDAVQMRSIWTIYLCEHSHNVELSRVKYNVIGKMGPRFYFERSRASRDRNSREREREKKNRERDFTL